MNIRTRPAGTPRPIGAVGFGERAPLACSFRRPAENPFPQTRTHCSPRLLRGHPSSARSRGAIGRSRRLPRLRLRWLALVVCAAFVCPTAALELVRDGQPVAVIVAAADAAAPAARGRARSPRLGDNEGSEALAVRILADWLKKITGADLPVVTAPPANQPAIYVGRAAVAAGLRLDDIPSPSREGLRIVVEDRRALIAGQNETATTKAVCRFLEELGCRYFMDGAIGEVYPCTNTLVVPPFTITDKPGLLMRNPKGPSWYGGYWKVWNGAGGESINHAHAWGRYIPKGLFAQHPEYFAQGRDGQRKDGDWLCTSHPEVRRLFAEQVIAAIRAGTRHPSISPPDGRGYCQCAACKAQDDPAIIEPSSGAVSVSRRYADFFDAVARRVAEACPDSVLSFYCYADYTQPPERGRRLAPNLCAVIAPIRYCRLHPLGHPDCPSRAQQVTMIEGWARQVSRLGYYNYMYNLADATLPFFKFSACRKEFPWLAERGLQVMTLEILSNWHIYGPHIYLGLRLAYAPQANAEAIMEDYWQKFYGPKAAPAMKAYWLGIDGELMRLHSHAGGFFGLAEIYTPEFLAQGQQRLARAAAAAQEDPRYTERVALHTEGFKSAVEYRQICDAMSRGDFAGALATYENMVTRLRGLAAKGWANPEYATAYLERFLAPILRAGTAVTQPPAKVLAVLPDQWRMAFDDGDQGTVRGFHRAAFDDTSWRQVFTYSKTLSSQGLSRPGIMWYRTQFTVPARRGKLTLFFAEVDGGVEVCVNGHKLEPAAVSPDGTRTGPPRKRQPFEVDVTEAVRSGTNHLAVRVDNRQITELFLGGIVRPVLLIRRE